MWGTRLLELFQSPPVLDDLEGDSTHVRVSTFSYPVRLLRIGKIEMDKLNTSTVLSLSPEEALGYLARIHTILIIHTSPPVGILHQKIYIHTLGFPDRSDLKQGCHEILEEFGFTPETFPAFAIQGYVHIAEIIEYDPQKFRSDRDLHGHQESLFAYQTRLNITSTWGLRFTDTYIFNEPILDVLPISCNSDGFWETDLSN